LARLVGASRETVNRTLSAFARRGWVLLNGGRVSVVDAEALSARAAL
jgi:DNA-binding GntR family transcriptional regulator